jgi:hypothetical protein
MRITVDKIASVTRRMNLSKTLTLTDRIEVRPGAVIAARVLNDKGTYNTLEDPHGRMSVVHSGDIVVGALGHRNALHGYEGVMPEHLAVGDKINLLNLGGVMGHAVSHNPDVGAPFEAEVLGQVLIYPGFQSRMGQAANIAASALKGQVGVPEVPVVYVAGTCMNSGKTAAASAVVRVLAQAGLRVGGAKLTGVSLRKDVLAMQDYGAEWALDFTDAGVPTSTPESAPESARIVFSELAAQGAQVIVAETGDGIMGDYGVQAVLADASLMSGRAALLFCANDPVGAVGGVKELTDRYGLTVDVLTGPATDNRVGVRFVERELSLPALNARTSGKALGERVLALVQEKLGVSI